MTKNKIKVLFIDVETAPLLALVWGIWNQDIGLNQLKKDWSILSFSARWMGSNEIIYFDCRKNPFKDRNLLKKIIKLLDQADVVIGHNLDKFDRKKINARAIMNGLTPPSPYKTIDTMKVAKKHFAFTSNKLEYLADKLCGLKKGAHSKFSGMSLWTECLMKNEEAWNEMEKYNKNDVVILEAVYKKLQPWDNSISFSLYSDGDDVKCNCGSEDFHKRGFYYSKIYKYQRYQCQNCGAWFKGGKNLSKKKVFTGI